MNLRFTLTVIITATVYISSIAQITADEAISAMGRGINMGNTLDATEFEGNWGTPAEEYYFDMYKDAGFKTIRVPITWHAGVSETDQTLRLSDTAPYEIDSTFGARVDSILKWSLDRDLYTIINVHHDGWIKDKNTFDTQKPRLYSLWTQLAEKYKDYPEHLFFEILNEPHSDNSITTAQVNELNDSCLKIIRAQNPTRIVFYGGPNWSASKDLFEAAIPDSNDNYLFGYYHSYDPWDFAGESNGTWGTTNDKKVMSEQMENVKAWSDSNSIPVFIGELGANKACDYNSRMRYYAHYTQEAIANNLAFAIWDDDGDFQMLQRVDSSWNDLKDIVIHTTSQSPTNVTAKYILATDTNVTVSWQNRADGCDSIILQRRKNDEEFIDLAKFTGDTTSYIDKSFEVKNYYYYRVIARYNDSIDVYSYPNRVFITPTERSTFHDTPFAVPGTIEAEDFDNGGQSLTYNETTATNLGNALDYRPEETVDIEYRIEGTDTTGLQVGYAEAGEWLEYTIDVKTTGTYTIIAHLASMDGGGEIGYKFANTSAKTTAPKTNSWQTTAPTQATVSLEAGEQIMRVNITSTPNYNIDKFEIVEGSSTNFTAKDNAVVYPNPATNTLYIKGYTSSATDRVTIHTITGNKIQSYTAQDLEQGLNITHLNTGYYLLVIESNNERFVKNFIKE